MAKDKVNIKYYSVVSTATIYEPNTYHNYATPKKSKKGKHLNIQKGKVLKSFGETKRLKLSTGEKPEFLLLINGDAIKKGAVKLYKANVSDIHAGGSPIVSSDELDKAGKETAIIEESGFTGGKKLDKLAISGLFVGAVVGGGMLWYKTREKNKIFMGIFLGAIIGVVIGLIISKTTKKKGQNDIVDKIEGESDFDLSKNKPKEGTPTTADAKFLQTKKEYEFYVPQAVYLSKKVGNVMHIATDKKKNKIQLQPYKKYVGTLETITNPEIFLLDRRKKVIRKGKVTKPIPYFKLGKDIYVPLSAVHDKAIIIEKEVNEFIQNKTNIDDDVYIKGRYGGKRYFNLLYLPQYEERLKKVYQKKRKR